jgi:hypothetical protein
LRPVALLLPRPHALAEAARGFGWLPHGASW